MLGLSYLDIERGHDNFEKKKNTRMSFTKLLSFDPCNDYNCINEKLLVKKNETEN